jgi:hypothetical protein
MHARCSLSTLNPFRQEEHAGETKTLKKKKTNLITGGLLNLKLVFASIFYDFTVFPLGC